MQRLVLAVVLWSCATLGFARAQEPRDRGALEQLRDSLGRVTDTVALRQLEVATIQVAKRDRDNPLIHLRLGFIAYRLGELGGKGHFDDAAGEFEWAGELRPGWPYPWYGDGLAELALGEHAVIGLENMRQILGLDYLSKAARVLSKATDADPSFSPATVLLARTALAQRIQPRIDLALRAVRAAAHTSAATNPAIQLARGRVERLAGYPDSALEAFDRLLAVGGDSGVALLERARTYYYLHQPDAAYHAYFTGAAHTDSADARDLYRSDFSWVASDSERQAFDALPDASARSAWLLRFWEQRAAADARDPSERLAEHYRRWFYVMHNFRLVSRHRHYDITERYRADQDQVDDRGVIYMRHGEPDSRATYVQSDSVEPNESWLYRRPDGDLIFHFVARKGGQDYKLVESLADALTSGFNGALALQRRSGMGPIASGLFASRSTFNPVYTRLGDVLGSANVRGSLAEERDLGKSSIAIGTTTDSYRRNFDAPLETVASQFVVGDTGLKQHPGGALHVVFAIPVDRLLPTTDSARTLYPISFRLYVTDSSGAIARRIDTTRVFVSRHPLPSGAYLSGQLTTRLPAGMYGYHLLIEQPGGEGGGGGGSGPGDLITRDSIRVGALDGTRFAVSDLVVGRADAGLVWTDRGDTVFLNPLEQFPEGSAAELYYEVYGVPAGAAYHTAVRLERRQGGGSVFGFFGRLFGGKKEGPVTLSFDAASDGPITHVHRQIALRDVPRGRYVLSVRITHPASGMTVTQEQALDVVGR